MSMMKCSLVTAAVAALAGTAHAGELAASSTTLHGATFGISYERAFIPGSGTLGGGYTGPSTNFLSEFDYNSNPDQTLSGDPLSGDLRFSIYRYDWAPQEDRVEGRFFFNGGGAASYYEATYTFDVEFNAANGGVEFSYGNDQWNWTIAPIGGSAVALNFADEDEGISGDVVANGRYTITGTFTHNGPWPADGAIISFAVSPLAAGSGGGGAVPGPGAAMIASMGLAGISRRRRR